MKKLVTRALQGDADAFVLLMSEYKTDMYRVAKSYLRDDEDAADAIQETVLACFEKLATLQSPDFFKTWMIRILINKCNDVIRSGRRLVRLDEIPETGREDRNQSNAEFMALLDTLGEDYRVVLTLRYGEGLSVREISAVLGISESAVKTRLKRGRDKFRGVYNDCKTTEAYI